MKKFFIAVLLSILLSLPAAGDLAKRIDAILAERANQKVQFSIHVVEAATAETVYDHDARELMMPASNMKLITTAAALHYLGPDFEYKTKVGLCEDTLIIIGSGDPLLGDPVIDAQHDRKPGWILDDIAAALKRKGITTISDVVVDTSVFDDQRVHPNWPADQLNRWYAAEVSGLNYNNNCVNIMARNTAGRIEIAVEPQTSFLEIINEIAAVSEGGSAIGAYRNRHPNKLTLKGKCQTQATITDLAIERPAAFFGFLLAENLARAGIKPQGRVIEKTVADRSNFKLLTEYTTPISDCLVRANKSSLGLAAEALLKTIAAESPPKADGDAGGSWEMGRELVGKYLSDAIGLDASQFFIDDGSGLSRVNELTANAVTKLLLNLYKSRKWQMYRDSLAVGGVDGTIEKFFYQSNYKGRVFAKTGYIEGVRALSGLCITEKGDFLFSILANNTNGLTRKAL
ncbi:MAG TPA: D-alanyl-D-alanine carboxypeptidase/D-alanyl-D-alanine-endopeptidase, partial [Sedimentisphaerales bacterium]|nr:D-alanyl-D-alanine carboxypeptidase/D-alanyl-D-alanine-endopeptidase [Sedimentisphaerales bacterium]